MKFMRCMAAEEDCWQGERLEPLRPSLALGHLPAARGGFLRGCAARYALQKDSYQNCTLPTSPRQDLPLAWGRQMRYNKFNRIV